MKIRSSSSKDRSQQRNTNTTTMRILPRRQHRCASPRWLSQLMPTLLLLSSNYVSRSAATTSGCKIVVFGSINADTFLPVARLPTEGENLTTEGEPVTDVPGGKGCTQAVAAAKLLLKDDYGDGSSSSPAAAAAAAAVSFVGQFGNDAAAATLERALGEAAVDTRHCGHHRHVGSGRGYVFLCTRSGQVSAVVSGGSNAAGWDEWKALLLDNHDEKKKKNTVQSKLDSILDDGSCQCVLLQREVPEFVNVVVARACRERGITVIQDVGGEDRPMTAEMLRLCDYIVPNESELERLVGSLLLDDGGPSYSSPSALSSSPSVVELAQILQQHGARNVLVTQGSRGSTLVCENGEVLHQPACPVLQVVDETGAGDCYRAGFAVALVQHDRSLQECMRFASAAGACSVVKRGAVPSTPTLAEVQERLLQLSMIQEEHHSVPRDTVLNIPRGDGLHPSLRGGGGGKEDIPFLIGSRLNSMKDRSELWDAPLLTPKDFVRRQATISGLTCVDFNYPQHFHTWSSDEAREALDEAGLVAGAVCLRFPSKFARGAMNHPDADLRREAIDLTKQAAQVAIELGCNEVVVWSAYDGYDYPFQVEYDTKWQELVEAFQECCDAFPDVKFSVEYKPTDENTRFFTIPSTAAAILLMNEVDRPNFGLTLDVGHMLMSGENPGQSIAMVGRTGKLFGIQLNDGYTRLAAEDGLCFGSCHPGMALEIMYQLRRTGFAGHFYFDTFPQRSDPVREAEYNIRRVKAFWAAADAIKEAKLREIMRDHDAIAALELVDEALRKM